VKGNIGGKTELIAGSGDKAERQTLEFAALRLINVENLSGTNNNTPGADGQAVDVSKVDLGSALHERLGTGAKAVKSKDLQNIGPSITYRLRDAAGQAREFHNYMAPVTLDGVPVYLVGMREAVADTFRYLRLPADENGSLNGWLRLRQALDDPTQRDLAAKRYVALATPKDRPEMADQLLVTTRRVLALFAGAEGTAPAGATPRGGLQGLGDFIESSVPENDRPRISEVMLRILNGALFELLNVSREAAGAPALQPGTAAQNFMQQAVTSLSDSFFYPVPLIFQLSDFTQVQASVFQVARAPGKTAVYLGAVLLIVGVFAMLYIRERRLWIWITPAEAGGSRLTAALSTTRRTLDADDEFVRIRQALLKETP
jgi:cytochrome c biogenesis protein